MSVTGFFDKKELAAELHLSTRSIERMMRTGEAPPFTRAALHDALICNVECSG